METNIYPENSKTPRPYVQQTILQPENPNIEKAAIKPANETKGILPISPIAVKSPITFPSDCLPEFDVRYEKATL